jgi:hypothetical protein
VSDVPERAPVIDPEVKTLIAGLDTDLQNARRHGARTSRHLHKVMLKDIRRAERQAREAEKRARRAERRADAAERELLAVRASATWKAGRVVVGVPARIKTGLTKFGRNS